MNRVGTPCFGDKVFFILGQYLRRLGVTFFGIMITSIPLLIQGRSLRVSRGFRAPGLRAKKCRAPGFQDENVRAPGLHIICFRALGSTMVYNLKI